MSVFSSKIRNKNGWLAIKWVWNRGRADLNPNRAVAAAASLPSSLTSMNDLCIAFEKLKDSVYCEATLESKKSVKSDGPSLKIMKKNHEFFVLFISSDHELQTNKQKPIKNENCSKLLNTCIQTTYLNVANFSKTNVQLFLKNVLKFV